MVVSEPGIQTLLGCEHFVAVVAVVVFGLVLMKRWIESLGGLESSWKIMLRLVGRI